MCVCVYLTYYISVYSIYPIYISLIFSFIIIFWGTTKIGLQALMLEIQISFLIVFAAAVLYSPSV